MFKNNFPGKSWWRGFMERHPDLKLKTPEKLEMSRAIACSEEKLRAWFRAYETMIKENKVIFSSLVYNCDESGFALQTRSGKVLVDRAVKSSYYLTSNNKTNNYSSMHTSRRQCSTAICFVSWEKCKSILRTGSPGWKLVIRYRIGVDDKGVI